MSPGRPDHDPSQKLRLDGRVALVTGASRGIGKASAAMLSSMGARVALSSRSADGLVQAIDEIRAEQPDADLHHVVANAGEADQIAAAVDNVVNHFGRVDILVNNAGTSPYYGPLAGMDLPRGLKTAQVNMFGPILWTQQVWERSMREHGGAIVNIISLSTHIVEQGVGIYAATKAALANVTKQFAAELGPAVRVNAIAPGLVKTDMARVLWEQNEERLAEALPLGRLGVPDDIAAAVLFLVSDESSWITGQTLVVDGGALVTPLAAMG